MTQLAEKSPFKSPRIYDCLLLLALEEILIGRGAVALTLVSPDRNLARAIEKLCENLAIRFTWQLRRSNERQLTLRKTYNVLPRPLQCLITLGKYLITRWPLCSVQKPQWFSDDKAVFICSYFFALDKASCETGHFYSRQWEGLPTYLHKIGKGTNWIQIFLYSLEPSSRTAINWVRRFNADAVRQGCHSFLESYLSWRVVARVLRRLAWLNIVAWRLRRVQSIFSPNRSAVWLWPILRNDWCTSLSGQIALCNCLWMELFDAALSDIPRQRIGLYLYENQGWERALLWAWRRQGHGQIIGVQHAAVSFWYLNYFDDPRSLTSTNSCAIPLPDRVAVNGPLAWQAFEKAGYPVDQLVPVEALRYQHLAALRLGAVNRRKRYVKANGDAEHRLQKNVLILGDFTVTRTINMLRCVQGAFRLINASVEFTLKNHPACRLDLSEDFSSILRWTDKPLSEILGEFDVAFISNTTSASLEAYSCGLEVLVFLDSSEFNFSPLRNVKGVRFISNCRELAVALQASLAEDKLPDPNDFFWLDYAMPKWSKLFSETGNQH